MAALAHPADLAVIDEEDDVLSDFNNIVDPVRLKRIRTGGKSSLTKAGKTLMQAIRVGDGRDTVRALRENAVIRFDD
jgi:hypothetical protein